MLQVWKRNCVELSNIFLFFSQNKLININTISSMVEAKSQLILFHLKYKIHKKTNISPNSSNSVPISVFLTVIQTQTRCFNSRMNPDIQWFLHRECSFYLLFYRIFWLDWFDLLHQRQLFSLDTTHSTTRT